MHSKLIVSLPENNKQVSTTVTDTIDLNSPLPRYYQVYQSLINRINSGEFTNNQALPADRQLALDYGVSRFTIAKALDQLKADGLIHRQHGRGTFVQPRDIINCSDQAHPLSQQFIKQGLEADWRLLETGWLTAPPAVRRAFNLSRNAKQYRALVVLSVNGAAIAYHQAYIPHALAMKYQLEKMSAGQLLQALREGPLVNGNAHKKLSAVRADTPCQQILSTTESEPMLALDTLYLDEPASVRLYSRTIFKGDKFSYQL